MSMSGIDYMSEELEWLKDQNFDFNEAIEFSVNHDIQVYRGSDWQYECMIDGEVHAIMLTSMAALVAGITNFKNRYSPL